MASFDNSTVLGMDAVVFDQRFVRYIAVCLRRYAQRWRKTLRVHSKREALTLNQPVFDDEGGAVE